MILLVRVFVFVVVAVAPCVLDIAVGVDFLTVQVDKGARCSGDQHESQLCSPRGDRSI